MGELEFLERMEMKQVALMLGVTFGLTCIAGDAWGLPQFKKAFEEKYEVKQNPEYKALMRKAGCNACHIKGEQDKSMQNDYGKALNELIEGSAKQRLDAAKEISRDEQKAELAKLVDEFKAALDEVDKKTNEAGETYGDRIRAGQLPVPLEESSSDS